jgi:HNH endonuclease
MLILKTMAKRPSIPRPLERKVLIEAGHRCAIPTCRQTPVEIAHIVPWATVKEHTFENLIALCPNCHSRHHKKEIDRKSLLQYKANLTLLNSHYGDLEQRVLKIFAAYPERDSVWLNKSLDILLMYFVEDGLIVKDDNLKYLMSDGNLYNLTPKGRAFIGRWLNAEALE